MPTAEAVPVIIGDVREFTTVTPTRPVDAANNTTVDLHPIDIVVYLDPPQVIGAGAYAGQGLTSDRGKRWMQTGKIRVRPGSDLRDGDEIPLPEGTFGVVGGPEPGRKHPITGNTFGWVRYAIRKGG